MASSKRIWGGLAAGIVGGVAGAFAMDQFQSLWTTISGETANKQDGQKRSASGDQDVIATQNTAQAISQNLFGRNLSKQQMKTAAPGVHYGIGILMGAVYGVSSETLPITAAGRGTLYGSAAWLFADEIAVPAFGLGARPSETPLSSQASSLASHVVFGFTADLVKRLFLGSPGSA